MHSSNFKNVRGGMSLKETKAVMTVVGQNPHPPVCVSDEKRTRASYSNTALPTQQKTTPQKARANGKRRAILQPVLVPETRKYTVFGAPWA